MKLLLNSTVTALWHEVIHDAASMCSVDLEEDLESYLIFLLIRSTDKPEVIGQAIAPEFLKGANAPTSERQVILQHVGDNCLLLSGLFPGMAEKRLVKLSYFVNLGQTAYNGISQHQNDIYESLSKRFVPLMDVLQAIRQNDANHPDLLPLQAYELWNDTGSQRALSVLRQYTSAIPLILPNKMS